MKRRRTKEQIIDLYNLIQQQKTSGLTIRNFFHEKGINQKVIWSFSAIIYWQPKYTDLSYSEFIEIAKKIDNKQETVYDAAKKNNLDPRDVEKCRNHFYYLDCLGMTGPIEPHYKTYFKKPMKFLKVQNKPETKPISPAVELITKKNDIQLFINEGIKVLISPDVDPMKIIKIIELLKDL